MSAMSHYVIRTIAGNVHDKRVLQTSECSKNPSTYTITIQSDISQQPNMPESSNEAKIILALQALQNDPKLSLRKAAAIYHVDRFTLSRRRHGILSKRDTLTKSRLLSDQEEDMIVQFILDLDSRGFPSRLLYVEDIANSLRANRGAPPVGKRWAHNFIKRQPELKTHKFRRYDYQRAKCEYPTIIRG
jgi:hypothetical protein